MATNYGALRAVSNESIDRAAGEARLKYITDVPGQQAVYLVKLAQSLAYLADSSTVPSYIAAEATARGVSAADVAHMVVATASLWNDDKGPAIEAARIGAKLAIDAAADAEGVVAARDAGLATLAAL